MGVDWATSDAALSEAEGARAADTWIMDDNKVPSCSLTLNLLTMDGGKPTRPLVVPCLSQAV